MKKRMLGFLLACSLLLCLFPISANAENTSLSTADVYEWKQSDKQWNTIYKANWSKGCSVTAIAIQIARTDLVRVDKSAKSFDKTNMTGFNPGTLAKAWKLKDNLSVTWANTTKVVPGFKSCNDNHFQKASNAGWNYFPANSKQEIVDGMRYFLDKEYYPIIDGPGSSWGKKPSDSRHYVAVISADDSDVRVIDPADGKEKSLFDVNVEGNKWTVKNIEKCGDPDGYGSCRLYKVDESKLLPGSTPGAEEKESSAPQDNYYELSASAYLESCKEYPTHCQVQINISKPEYIKTIPCSVTTNVNAGDIRELENGEVLTAVGVYQNTQGNYWYKVDLGGGGYGYIFAGTTQYLESVMEDPEFSDVSFSKATYNKSRTLKGSISTQNALIKTVSGKIVDSSGAEYSASADVGGKKSFSIKSSAIDKNLKFKNLSAGNATMSYDVELIVYYCTSGTTLESTTYYKTFSWDFTVE